MQADVVILGAAGMGGGELLRLLSQHPAVQSLTCVSRSGSGKSVAEVHPHLHSLVGLKFVRELDWSQLKAHQPLVVFSAMQHGELAVQYEVLNASLSDLARSRSVVLLDLSADFRLRDAEAYAAHYGHGHPSPNLLGSFVYGLPEANRTSIQGATRIACPGCFATAMNLALLPLAQVPDLGLVAISGVTGSSGSGARPSETTHHPVRAHDFRSYNPLRHRHMAEVEQVLQEAGASGYELSFIPHSGPFVRGIHITVQCRLASPEVATRAADTIRSYYAAEPFVRNVDRAPRVATVACTNFAELACATDGSRLAVMCAIDNLGKGMAGQALQNMNLALGLDETLGLLQPAVYP